MATTVSLIQIRGPWSGHGQTPAGRGTHFCPLDQNYRVPNTHIVAHFDDILEDIHLEGCARSHPHLRGIPIIHSLLTGYLGDSITRVVGIVIGATNFMLSKMEDEGVDYGASSSRGCGARPQYFRYTEANPEADVKRLDVQVECLIFDLLSKPSSVISSPPGEECYPGQDRFREDRHALGDPYSDISAITAVDFEYARLLKSTIKLLGTAALSGGKLSVYVSPPVIVPLSSPLASAKGPGNMVVVNSANMVQSIFAGPGAGRGISNSALLFLCLTAD